MAARPGHAVSLWPDIAKAHAEADARGVADELRTELERLAAVLQLAAGDAFEAIWSRSKNGPVPPGARAADWRTSRACRRGKSEPNGRFLNKRS